MLAVRLLCLPLVLTAVFYSPSARAAEPSPIPEDECLLELTLPRGASVSINGKNYGDRRSLRWRGVKPGKWYPIKADIRFADGSTVTRDLFIRGGWCVPLAMLAPKDARPELVLQSGHTSAIRGVAISADGSRIVTASDDNTAIVWDGRTGKKLRTLVGHESFVRSVAISADGGRIFTGSNDHTNMIWDGRTGKKLRTIDVGSTVDSLGATANGGHVVIGVIFGATVWNADTGERQRELAGAILEAAISSDGSHIVTVPVSNEEPNKTAVVWNGRTGEKLRTLEGHDWAVSSAAISADGSRIVTGSGDRTAIVWNGHTGERLQTLKGGHAEWITSVAITDDGSRVITASFKENHLTVWDTRTGEKLRTLAGHAFPVNAVAVTPDGSRIVSGSSDRTAIVWDGRTGERIWTFKDRAGGVNGVAISSGGGRIVTTANHTALCWNATGGDSIRALRGHTGAIYSLTMTGDGTRIVTGASDNTAIVWNGGTGEPLRTLKGHADRSKEGYSAYIPGVAISEDGSRIFTGGGDAMVVWWNGRTGERRRAKSGHTRSIRSLAATATGDRVVSGADYDPICVWDGNSGEKLFSLEKGNYVHDLAMAADGSRILSTSDHSVVVWDGRNGDKLRTLEGHSKDVLSVAATADIGRIVTASEDTTAILWDGATGDSLRILSGHTDDVKCVAIAADGRRIVTGSADGAAALWDGATGDLLCRLISLDSGKDWLVVTPEGLFDGSAGGREKVTFRIPGEEGVVPVDRFFQDFYRPGLLAALLRGERPMPEIEIGQALPPVVKITSPKAGEVEEGEVVLEVEATDQGGGIGPLTLFHNGARMLGRGEQVKEGNVIRRTFTVALLEGENRLRVSSASADGSWESEPAEIVLKYARPLEKPRLHVLAVGVSDYAQTSLKLDYPARDAESLAALFEKRGGKLYEKIEAKLIVDSSATREGIITAMKEAGAATRPQDTFVVFFAGHGAMVGQRYYFVPQEFSRKEDSIEADLRAQGLPADEIGDYLAAAHALKRVLILDTCSSGGALGSVTRARSGFEFRGTVERLSRTQGVFTIAASSAGQEAIESRELGSGVLTYALRAGLADVSAGPLVDTHIRPGNAEQVVDVMEWFTFAAGQVPRITEELHGAPQDVETSTQGQNFPVLPLR